MSLPSLNKVITYLLTYSNHLREEMEQIEGTLITERGEQVVLKFQLIPSDMKWISSHSRELNNCATYSSPFANVNRTNNRWFY